MDTDKSGAEPTRRPDSLPAGRQIGGYRILERIGAGGMGEVYRAKDTRLGRDVAIKILPRHRAGDPAREDRFLREAQAASALNHPNILSVYDVGTDDGISFIVSEFVPGVLLSERIRQGAVPVKELLSVAAQIADGLAAAHQARIVHRDLKPDNIIVTPDGRVKILDFGLAKTSAISESLRESDPSTQMPTDTEAGIVLGTVPYMSPEQARGVAVDYRSDQFSLGIVIYELGAGVHPFKRNAPVQTLSAIIGDEAAPLTGVNPRIPGPLAWIVERCLAKTRSSATRQRLISLTTSPRCGIDRGPRHVQLPARRQRARSGTCRLPSLRWRWPSARASSSDSRSNRVCFRKPT